MDYFNVFFIYYFRYIVIEHVGDVRGLLDALKSRVGKYRITCGLF